MMTGLKRVFQAMLAAAAFGGAAMAQEDPIDFNAASADGVNWRAVDPENLIVFEVADMRNQAKGSIYIELAPFAAPNHVTQLKMIVRSGKYDGTVFHRVIDDFMAQGGDIMRVSGEDSGLPNLQAEFSFKRNPEEMMLDAPVEAEYATLGYINGFPVASQSPLLLSLTGDTEVESWITHCKGATSMARTGDPNSANSQFFLMRETRQHLDYDQGQYTAWGRIIEGQDVVDRIKSAANDPNGAVTNPDVLSRARMVADLPESQRPQFLVERTDSPQFLAKLKETGEVDTPCDLPRPRTLMMEPTS